MHSDPACLYSAAFLILLVGGATLHLSLEHTGVRGDLLNPVKLAVPASMELCTLSRRVRESERERCSRIDSDNARARGGERAWSLHYTCLLLVALKMSATRPKHVARSLLLSAKFVVLSERGQATWTCMPSSASCLSPYNCP